LRVKGDKKVMKKSENNFCSSVISVSPWSIFMFFGITVLTVGMGWASSGEDAYQKGDYEGARKYYEERIGKTPDDAEALYNLGNSLYQLKRYEESSEAFGKSVERKPGFEHGWYNLGLALAQQEEYEGAAKAFERALQIDPADEDARRNLELMKKKMEQHPAKKKKNSKKDKVKKDENSQAGAKPAPDQPKKGGEDQKQSNPPGKQKGDSPENQKKPSDSGQGQDPGKKDRKEEARRNLGLSEDEIKDILSQTGKREQMTRPYFSANPKKEMEKRGDIWNFLPGEQQEYMRRLFGKDKGVAEDW
jgi:Ca-activated chloride channel homolog